MKTATPYLLRRATPADLRSLSALLRQASEWMHAERGTDAWKREGFPDSRLRPGLDAGAVWLMHTAQGVLIGAIQLDRHPDPEFEVAAVDTSDALIVHRMVGSRHPAYADVGFARTLLDFATDRAARCGLTWVMLNCNRAPAAERLRRRYQACGFDHIATVQIDGRKSGWLAKRKARLLPGLSMRLTVEC